MRIRPLSIVSGGLVLVAATAAAAGAVAPSGPDTSSEAPVVHLEESPTGQVPVGDRDGVVRGTVDVHAMDRMSEIAGRFLAANDVVLARAGDGPAALDADAMALSDAVMVLEAIPVYGPDGKTIVGRFGARFIEEASFEAARAEAQEVVVEATGRVYRSK